MVYLITYTNSDFSCRNVTKRCKFSISLRKLKNRVTLINTIRLKRYTHLASDSSSVLPSRIIRTSK